MSTDYISLAKKFHIDLCSENRVIETLYQGLKVYKINQKVKGMVKLTNLNTQDYFYNVSTIQNYTGDKGEKYTSAQLAEVLKPENKKGICLHYTAGSIGSDLPILTGGRGYISVPFMISHCGNIYQLSDPDTDISWHNSPRSPSGYSSWHLHNQVIGIEISNMGYLLTSEEVKASTSENITATEKANAIPDFLYDGYGSQYCSLNETNKYYDLKTALRDGKSDFRTFRYFATYTDEQYIALNKLIGAICNKYPQIERKILPETERYDFYGTGNDKWDKLVSWKGISSHANYNSTKQDIGPAFDWDRIAGNQFCFPFEGKQTTKSTPSVQWYANTEARKMGGYFPIGANRSFHSGVHLFSRENKQAIKAMAPGYVTAFRFLSNADFHNALYDFRKETSLTHAKSTSFVLLRHEVKFEGEDASRSFYSLYMDIENPENNDTEIIPWLSKLKDYTLGSRISFEYKTLGITDHWEVFSDDRKENNNFQGAAA